MLPPRGRAHSHTRVQQSPLSPGEALVRIVRSESEESVHRGHVIVMEGTRRRAFAGDPGRRVFARSTVKPMQALVGFTSGAVDAFHLSPRSIAVASASHNAEADHLEAVLSLLESAGIDASYLSCGGHYSLSARVARDQRAPAGGPPPIWCNCSGKHAMMLAAAKALGAPLEGYLEARHPVQADIADRICELCEVGAEDISFAVDGCGAPAPHLTMTALARGFVRLATAANEHGGLSRGAQAIFDAMRQFPLLVAGTGRFDTELMVAGAGHVIAKCGAEGLHAVTVPARELAIVVKVDDGSDRGYRGVVIELLRRLGVLSDDTADALRERHAAPVLRNHAGAAVGALHIEVPELD